MGGMGAMGAVQRWAGGLHLDEVGSRRQQPAPPPAPPRSFLAERGERQIVHQGGFSAARGGPPPSGPCPRFAGEGENCITRHTSGLCRGTIRRANSAHPTALARAGPVGAGLAQADIAVSEPRIHSPGTFAGAWRFCRGLRPFKSRRIAARFPSCGRRTRRGLRRAARHSGRRRGPRRRARSSCRDGGRAPGRACPSPP